MKTEPGMRVRMVGVMRDDPAPIPVGDEGVIDAVFNEGQSYEQIAVKWDSGRRLFLLPDDPFIVLP